MPLTPAHLSGSQLTYQLRMAADGKDGTGHAFVGWPEDLLNASAEYIDHLQRRVVAMEERTPARPLLVTVQPPFEPGSLAHYIFTSGGAET